MGWESFVVFRSDLGPLFQGQTWIAKLKSAYNSLILVLEVCNVKPTHKKSWAENLLIRFDLEPLFQHQTMTAIPKSAYNSLIIEPRGLQCETNS